MKKNGDLLVFFLCFLLGCSFSDSSILNAKKTNKSLLEDKKDFNKDRANLVSKLELNQKETFYLLEEDLKNHENQNDLKNFIKDLSELDAKKLNSIFLTINDPLLKILSDISKAETALSINEENN
ncbi:hypothetical protein OY14_04520 (plasmid) [Borreliella chilensis]|uniref:Lipoprotein n=1 Tax=Borreliella chilensis TaxID=1245910 RepID=A0A0A7UZ73_9SPIR|nr:hypothetical protein OY14_04520 [Borreliella chilensis]